MGLILSFLFALINAETVGGLILCIQSQMLP